MEPEQIVELGRRFERENLHSGHRSRSIDLDADLDLRVEIAAGHRFRRDQFVVADRHRAGDDLACVFLGRGGRGDSYDAEEGYCRIQGR